ncbi:hypothetical protein B0H14DRAFT_2686877 [Mycena olivaceomarginata]|nr:hypothetical protein B0H14DRAFT_2686877 [Mycena olivaceomarginata]
MLVSLRVRSESWSLDPRVYPRVILGLIIPGLGLTTILLALFGYAAWNIVSRRYLDRVSFRLLTYALVAQYSRLWFSFSLTSLAGYTDWRCSLLSFLTNSSLMFPSCIFFCMGLNVPLVVVYKISGQAMEKYYVAGTILIWEFGAFLMILGSTCCGRPAHTESTYPSEGAGSTILKFRNIILRIGLYPLISCLLNVTGTGISVYASREYKMEDTILMLASQTAPDAPLIYGLVAATDPSFIRAIRALRHPDSETETQFCRSGCLSTIVDLPPHVISFDDGGAVDNDHGRQERMRAIAPGSDLEVGKKSLWRSYFTITSGTSTNLSMGSRASTPPVNAMDSKGRSR